MCLDIIIVVIIIIIFIIRSLDGDANRETILAGAGGTYIWRDTQGYCTFSFI